MTSFDLLAKEHRSWYTWDMQKKYGAEHECKWSGVHRIDAGYCCRTGTLRVSVCKVSALSQCQWKYNLSAGTGAWISDADAGCICKEMVQDTDANTLGAVCERGVRSRCTGSLFRVDVNVNVNIRNVSASTAALPPSLATPSESLSALGSIAHTIHGTVCTPHSIRNNPSRSKLESCLPRVVPSAYPYLAVHTTLM